MKNSVNSAPDNHILFSTLHTPDPIITLKSHPSSVINHQLPTCHMAQYWKIQSKC